MKWGFGRTKTGGGGCSEREIAEMESTFGVRFPSPYRRFLARFGRDGAASPTLVGSDYYVPRLLELRSWAEELLRECDAPITLHPKDFVMLMHQGYQFYYFRADGASDDPPVFYYLEGESQPERKYDTLSDWLRDFGVYVH